MSDRWDNKPGHPDWQVERRPCPFCLVMQCGCPSEPDPIMPPNIELGSE